MRAVLLFSALLHIVAIGAIAAIGLRAWLNADRSKEPATPEFVAAAGALGIVVALVGTLFSWMGRPFGPALTTGLAAGLLAALAFMLALGVMSYGRQDGAAAPPSIHVRISGLSLVTALVLTEVVAFCFLVASASRAAPYT